MISKRLELHEQLEKILGSENVYFQPPPTVKMDYPCIVYKRNNLNQIRADDGFYNGTMGYQVTIIDPNPDSEIPLRMIEIPLCRFDRHYTADNLNHDVFSVYY